MSDHEHNLGPRTIVVGDIHGCYDELMALSARCELIPETVRLSASVMFPKLALSKAK